MVATIIKFSAGDEVNAGSGLNGLDPSSTDVVLDWQHDNLVFTAKVQRV